MIEARLRAIVTKHMDRHMPPLGPNNFRNINQKYFTSPDGVL